MDSFYLKNIKKRSELLYTRLSHNNPDDVAAFIYDHLQDIVSQFGRALDDVASVKAQGELCEKIEQCLETKITEKEREKLLRALFVYFSGL